MNELIGAKAPGWFRLAALLGLAWNAIGVFMYLKKVGLFGDPLAGMGEAERALAGSVPAWVTGAFAIAVFSGLLGALGLVLLKRWSNPLLLVSVIAIVAQQVWILGMSDALAVHGNVALMMGAVILVIAALLVWLGNVAARKGWLG
jgi:hypothetical protein